PLKPAFLARQLATSADVYLLANGRLLCESRFCRGGDQNNRSRQCTKNNECAHHFLLSCCHLQVGQLPIVFLPSGDSVFIRLAAPEPPPRRSFCLNFSARELDHLAPLLDFFTDKPVEVGRRAGKRRATELSNPCLRPRVGKSGVELLVELFHDLDRRVPWRANAIPRARLIAWQEIVHRPNVPEELRTHRRRHRQRSH